jgi:hypothetical protein
LRATNRPEVILITMSAEWGRLDRLIDLAESIAGSWGARGRNSTSVGQERAVLRLFGVQGLDGRDRPLAGEVVDRYVGRDASRLSAGIALPFAMALLEYDLTPQQLAHDVTSGAIDLALEAELLREPDRRAVAEEEARRLAEAAVDRMDANRTARRELVGLLGEAPRPWLGTTLAEPAINRAIREAVGLVGDGIDLLRVEVPLGRELATRLTDAGMELPDWPSFEWPFDSAARRRGEDEVAPTGSQRGIADLRAELDETAAGRRRYVALGTAGPALAAPEQAVVAAFERIDVVEADPMAEIVSGNVDPDRALSDHSFAHRLLKRAGTMLLIGPGPLVVAPDLASGLPSDAATRAGRALALQLLAATLAKGDGLPAEQIAIGGLPAWLTDEPRPVARAVAEVAVRTALFPGHALAFEEPQTTSDRSGMWPFMLAAILPGAGRAAFVLRRPSAGSAREAIQTTRAAVAVAREMTDAHGDRALDGPALEHARALVRAATETLERLGDAGWRSILGESLTRGERLRLGSDAVVERTESFDPLAPALEPAI